MQTIGNYNRNINLPSNIKFSSSAKAINIHSIKKSAGTDRRRISVKKVINLSHVSI
jgi:hypothetical protein